MEIAKKSAGQTLILLPTIKGINDFSECLTPEFRKQAAFLSSEVHQSKNKYFDEWQKVRKNTAKYVIGSRSAVFAPFADLKTIIVHNSHSFDYKQSEQNPRYSAIKAVEILARLFKARLMKSSYCFSFDDFFKAKEENLKIISFNKYPPGKIKIIDLNDEIKKKNYTLLSDTLLERIKKNFNHGKKVLLIAGKRGMSSLIMCPDCQHQMNCPDCKIALTLHSDNFLRCHYCGFKQEMPLSCPVCDSNKIKIIGKGTQGLKRQLQEIFPKINIIRFDKDSNTEMIKSSNADLIIGTPMLLNQKIENIGLIALTAADSLINLPDISGSEKMRILLYKLLSVGYISNNCADIIVQSFAADTHVLLSYKNQSFVDFFIAESESRKKLNLPPYFTLIKIIYQSPEKEWTRKHAIYIYKALKAKFERKTGIISIYEPLPSYPEKTRNKYSFRIIIKMIKNSKIEKDLLKWLPPEWVIDKDPISLL